MAVSAQGLAGGNPVQDLVLTLSPELPSPYSTATLSVQSTTLDLSASDMNVLVNGTSIYKGNVKGIPVKVGAAGSQMTIKVTVGSASQTLSVHPAGVALIQEPQSSAPPLYMGKPLVPQAGSVRLVAVADFRTSTGKPIDPATLAYTWSQDDTTLQSYSGVGKSSYMAKVPLQYRAAKFSVKVSTQDGSQAGGATVSLMSQQPTARIYENDPLLGIRFDRALGGTFTITNAEESFYGAPYSFSITNALPTLSWFLNGDAAETGSVVTLRPSGSGKGTASLSLVANNDSTLENASAGLSLIFGASSGGLFGL